MQLTPTVISAQPLEKAFHEYLDRHDHVVVALAIVAICTWANTIGSLIPLVAQRFKVDPALVSAPLITTLVDATGLAIYLLIAKALLSALR